MNSFGFKQYDAVRLKEVKVQFPCAKDAFNLRLPEIGDIACIVEIYTDPPGYELECSDANGITQWLMSFGPEDVEFELVK